MKKAPRSVDALLRSPPQALTSVLRQVTFLQEIEALVHEGLPPDARREVRVAACDDHRLVLLVSNAGWATRLRYQQSGIRRALAQRLRRHVERVEIRIRPLPHSEPSRRVRSHLSPQAREHIAASARWVDDPGLARALRRLSEADA